MGRSLYESLGPSRQNQNERILDQFGGPAAFQQRLTEFAENFRRQANCTPEQMVRQLMSTGQMTQAQFNQFSQIASSITGKR